MEVCHTNGVSDDNRPENLRYDTPMGNHADRHRHGTVLSGERNPNAKVTEADVLAMRERYAAGSRPAEIARAWCMNRQHVSRIVRGVSWRHAGRGSDHA
jgi:hypothetical protein